jgi:hypothetical protein
MGRSGLCMHRARPPSALAIMPVSRVVQAHDTRARLSSILTASASDLPHFETGTSGSTFATEFSDVLYQSLLL